MPHSAKAFYDRVAFTASPTLVPRLSTEDLIMNGSEEGEGLKDYLLSEPDDPSLLAGKRIALIATDGVEQIEVTGPMGWFRSRGATVEVVSPRKLDLPPKFGVQMPDQRDTHILTIRLMENAGYLRIDRFIDEVATDDFDAIIIPGGAWNPDFLRSDPAVLRFVTDFFATGKTVASICHGPQVLISADLVRGKKATCYWAMMVDLKNAGAEVSDTPCVVDGNLITARFPFDLPPFSQAIVEAVTKADVGKLS